MLDTYITPILALGTIGLQIIAVVLLVCLLYPKKAGSLLSALSAYSGTIIASIALLSTLGSLFYSDVVGLEPCTLCWWERFFMYGIAAISVLALIRKEFNKLLPYIILLSVPGALLTAYHVYIQAVGTNSFVCDLTVKSCTEIDFISMGYVTMPIMALTAFIAILFISIIGIKYQERV